MGEIEQDGIFLTPDGFDFEYNELEEAKATWRGSGRDLTDPTFWDYIVQCKSYCYAMQSEVARLRVLYINGDYRHTGPEYRRYELRFI